MASMAGISAGKRHFSASLAPVGGQFAYFSGGNITISNGKAYNGGAQVPDIIVGRGEVGDITLRRPWRPNRDLAVWKYLRGAIRLRTFTVSLVSRDQSGIAYGKPIVFTGCRLASLNTPEYDEASDNEPAVLEIVLTPQSSK